MYLSSGHRHLATVDMSHRHDELSHFHRVFVADFEVINMPTHGHLGTVDNLVCHAGIVRIDLKTHVFKFAT